MDRLSRTAALCTVSLISFLSGCSDLGSEPSPSENLILSIKAAHEHLSPAKVDHQNLAISSVKILLRSADLRREDSGDDVVVVPSERVIEVRFDGEIRTIGSVSVPPDNYTGLSVTIQPPEGASGVNDPDFVDSADGNKRYSLIVRGEYHETPFVYRSQEQTIIALAFDQPMRLAQRQEAHITLELNPYAWFNVGPLLLDPFNQGKEIDENLKRTFAHIFRDDDRDGEPD